MFFCRSWQQDCIFGWPASQEPPSCPWSPTRCCIWRTPPAVPVFWRVESPDVFPLQDDQRADAFRHFAALPLIHQKVHSSPRDYLSIHIPCAMPEHIKRAGVPIAKSPAWKCGDLTVIAQRILTVCCFSSHRDHRTKNKYNGVVSLRD